MTECATVLNLGFFFVRFFFRSLLLVSLFKFCSKHLDLGCEVWPSNFLVKLGKLVPISLISFQLFDFALDKFALLTVNLPILSSSTILVLFLLIAKDPSIAPIRCFWIIYLILHLPLNSTPISLGYDSALQSSRASKAGYRDLIGNTWLSDCTVLREPTILIEILSISLATTAFYWQTKLTVFVYEWVCKFADGNRLVRYLWLSISGWSFAFGETALSCDGLVADHARLCRRCPNLIRYHWLGHIDFITDLLRDNWAIHLAHF